ncbi:hypothetical protein AMTR_s00110p00120980, partial [Amborella trichopoda]
MLFGTFGSTKHPFEDPFLTIGFVSDETVIDAFLRIPSPFEGILPTADARHVWGDFAINPFGLALASDTPVEGRGKGIYVLGRGTDKFALTCPWPNAPGESNNDQR